MANDEVFIIVLNYNGDYGGPGIYQDPREGNSPNAGTRIEPPTFQRNKQVRKITSVSVSDGYNTTSTGNPPKGKFCHFMMSAKSLSLLLSPAAGYLQAATGARDLNTVHNDQLAYGSWESAR